MLKEEKYLNEVMGRKNPFRVPEGYFDDFADRMMEMLPEKTPVVQLEPAQHTKPKKQRSALIVKLKQPWVWGAASTACAAVFCGFMIMKGVHTNNYTAPEQQTATVTTVDSYLDEAADYAMVDNQEIYACLTGDY